MGDAGHLKATGEKVGPIVQILLGVPQDLAFAGGARAGMDAHDLLKGHRP
jgi:hypothetical protein